MTISSSSKALALGAISGASGMMIANTPAVFLGEEVVKRISLNATRIAAALLFAALGAWQLVEIGISG